jgi:hypothetical protein
MTGTERQSRPSLHSRISSMQYSTSLLFRLLQLWKYAFQALTYAQKHTDKHAKLYRAVGKHTYASVSLCCSSSAFSPKSSIGVLPNICSAKEESVNQSRTHNVI